MVAVRQLAGLQAAGRAEAEGFRHHRHGAGNAVRCHRQVPRQCGGAVLMASGLHRVNEISNVADFVCTSRAQPRLERAADWSVLAEVMKGMEY